MAGAKKGATILVKLASAAGTGFFYVKKKNPRTLPRKLEVRAGGMGESGARRQIDGRRGAGVSRLAPGAGVVPHANRGSASSGAPLGGAIKKGGPWGGSARGDTPKQTRRRRWR
jgi:ribosomal protein L33